MGDSSMAVIKFKHLYTLLLLSLLLIAPIFSQTLSEHEVKARIIKESIASYRGQCPCPYHKARNGSQCGRRSAYSKPGGYSPKCYASDISSDEVESWRQQNKSR